MLGQRYRGGLNLMMAYSVSLRLGHCLHTSRITGLSSPRGYFVRVTRWNLGRCSTISGQSVIWSILTALYSHGSVKGVQSFPHEPRRFLILKPIVTYF